MLLPSLNVLQLASIKAQSEFRFCPALDHLLLAFAMCSCTRNSQTPSVCPCSFKPAQTCTSALLFPNSCHQHITCILSRYACIQRPMIGIKGCMCSHDTPWRWRMSPTTPLPAASPMSWLPTTRVQSCRVRLLTCLAFASRICIALFDSHVVMQRIDAFPHCPCAVPCSFVLILHDSWMMSRIRSVQLDPGRGGSTGRCHVLLSVQHWHADVRCMDSGQLRLFWHDSCHAIHTLCAMPAMPGQT